MEFAVIKTGGKQYKVKVGDVLDVDRLQGEENKSIEFSDVLLWYSESDIKIGKPNVDGASVKALIVSHQKGDKIRVAKFKAKVRYRKVMGFRPHQTTLKIEKLSVGTKAKVTSAKSNPKPTKSK